MKTSLGLSFLRIVNEEGSNGWAQVYARIPFDDFELRDKGALFGAVMGRPTEGWAEKMSELMVVVDEFFNKSDVPGDLSGLVAELKNKYPEVEGVWLWVIPNDRGERDIKVVRWGNVGLILKRSGKTIDFSETEDGRIVKGIVADGDAITIWTGVLKDLLNEEHLDERSEEDVVADWSRKLMDDRVAGAGLVLNFEKYELEEIAKDQVKKTLDKPVLPVVNEPEHSSFDEVLSRRDNLADETYVGPLGIKEKIVNWWKKKRRSNTREIRIETDNGKRKKWAVLLGILFLILLSVSLVTGSVKMSADRETKRWVEFSEPIEKKYQEAIGLVGINPNGAKKLMEEVKSAFDLRKMEFVKTKHKDELALMEKKINDGWILASGEKESQIEEIVNIGLIRQGFAGDRLSLVKDSNFLALDGKLGIAVEVEIKTKDIKVVAGKGENQNWIDVVNSGTRTLVMSKSGIRIAGKEQDLIVFDSAVSNPIALGKFGGNIYILDNGNKEIYRYGAIGDTFGERVRWLKQDQTITINPVDMAIDADVWIAGNSGEVEKYRRGSKENFSLNGTPEGLKIDRLALEESGNRLALLDKTNGIVVICQKDNGNCSQQLRSERLKSASDVEFDATGTLWVLVSGTIGTLK